MLLSIITATYNRVNLLKKNYFFLKRNKNSFNFEWIVVCEENDHKTVKFLNKIRNEKFIKVIKGKFQSADKAYVCGFRKAKGKYLNIHGDDDFFVQNTFGTLEKYLVLDKEWIIGQADYLNNNFKKIRPLTTFVKNFLLRNFNKKILLIINFVMTPSIFFKKKIFNKIGGYDNDILYGVDYILWLKFNKLYTPLIVQKNLSNVIFNPNTKTGTFDLKRYFVFSKKMKKYSTGYVIRMFQLLSLFLIMFINFILKKILKSY